MAFLFRLHVQFNTNMNMDSTILIPSLIAGEVVGS